MCSPSPQIAFPSSAVEVVAIVCTGPNAGEGRRAAQDCHGGCLKQSNNHAECLILFSVCAAPRNPTVSLSAQDPARVKAAGPPKSVTVEDSFKGCPGAEAARRVIKVLAPDFLQRLAEEHEVFWFCLGHYKPVVSSHSSSPDVRN